jgi:hypothetical protein
MRHGERAVAEPQEAASRYMPCAIDAAMEIDGVTAKVCLRSRGIRRNFR